MDVRRSVDSLPVRRHSSFSAVGEPSEVSEQQSIDGPGWLGNDGEAMARAVLECGRES